MDFDELDKAVNSLMAGVDSSKRNVALDEPEEKVVSLESTIDNAKDGSDAAVVPVASAVESSAQPDEPIASALDPVPAPAPTPSSVAPAPLATKRRGQFMDVMHPSSDMKTAAKPVRRDTVVIAPVASATNSMPEVKQPAAAPEEEATSVLSSFPEKAPEALAEPLSSPFLPDAKPEKRPLGGLAAPADIPEAPTNEPAEVPSDDSDIEKQTPVAEPVVVPAELGSDVLAVESNDLTATSAEPTSEAVSDTLESTLDPVVEEVADASLPEPSSVPAGGSIPQQYTEAPSTGDQTSGSIYDTANYHQPISGESAPHKKSSPLKWILLAVALLIIGGAAGVGYFFLTR